MQEGDVEVSELMFVVCFCLFVWRCVIDKPHSPPASLVTLTPRNYSYEFFFFSVACCSDVLQVLISNFENIMNRSCTILAEECFDHGIYVAGVVISNLVINSPC
jgi:hypothetical protein